MSLPEQQKLLHPIGYIGGTDNGHGGLSAEYHFVHQRIPEHNGKQKYFLPSFLLTLQIIFIILFGFFASYETVENDSQKYSSKILC